MKLQNPQIQEKTTALLEQFNNQKETLIMVDRELAALHMQQAKNNATIAAVKSEYEQEAAAIKAKFEQSHALALDDYTLIQKAKAELKARLDFFTATGEELEEKIYQKSEQVFTAKAQLLATRKHLIFSYGEALANEFIQQHIEQITLFRSLIVNGIEYDPITEKDGKDVFNEMIIKKLSGFDNSLPDEFKLPTLNLQQDWKPKTPSQRHIESFQAQESKGFKRLLDNM